MGLAIRQEAGGGTMPVGKEMPAGSAGKKRHLPTWSHLILPQTFPGHKFQEVPNLTKIFIAENLAYDQWDIQSGGDTACAFTQVLYHWATPPALDV
jgi:hypothetical protein